MCICMCMCMCVYVCACKYKYVCICMYVCMGMGMCMRMYMCSCVRSYTHPAQLLSGLDFVAHISHVVVGSHDGNGHMFSECPCRV